MSYLFFGANSLLPAYLRVGERYIVFTDVSSGRDFSVNTGSCGSNTLPSVDKSPATNI